MHYVIVLESDTQDNHEVDIIGIAHSIEDAYKIFNEQREIEREIAADNEWTTYVDCRGMYEACPEYGHGEGYIRLWIQGVIE